MKASTELDSTPLCHSGTGKIMIKRLTIIPILISAFCILAVCTSKKPSTPDGNGAELLLSVAQSTLADQIKMVVLRAFSDADTVVIDSTAIVDGNFDFGLVLIPVGTAQLVIKGLDESRRVIYAADTVVQIESGVLSPVAVKLEPAIPMIKLSPYYGVAEAGQTFVTRLEIYNIERLFAAKLKVSFDTKMAAFDQLLDLTGSAIDGAEKEAVSRGDTVDIRLERPAGADDRISTGATVIADLRFSALGPGRLELSVVADSMFTSDGGIDTSQIYFDGRVVDVTGSVSDSVVYFPDANFEAAVRDAIDKQSGSILASELTVVDSLDAGIRMIEDISGAEYLINLQSAVLCENEIGELSPLANLVYLKGLYLKLNFISDLSPLANLTNVAELDISENNIGDISVVANFPRLRLLMGQSSQIEDISSLSELDSLEVLDMARNNISDVSPLANVTSLRHLLLRDNGVSDISPLANLVNLEVLDLGNNWLYDIDAISSLPNLRVLDIFSNDIVDIGPLVLNTGFGEGDTVYLDQNPLNETSLYEYIPALKDRGVEVYYDFDSIPPYPITDLFVDSVTSDAVRLMWTAPSDADDFKTVYEYEIRYATDSVTVAEWVDAILIPNNPVPQEPGTQESVWITGLQAGTEYYFGIKSTDFAGNWSDMSVIAYTVTMPPP